jgi:pyrroline-5-carboxylate reductase
MSDFWYFYLARCSDGSLYAGVSTHVERRMGEHNAGKGSAYTRSRLPVRLVYKEEHPTQGEALRREAEVKKWRKKRKEGLISQA